MPELHPLPFAELLTRTLRELDARGSVFGLRLDRCFLGDPERDLSVRFQGKRASTPFGPAAGPHTQMAQNLVLSWLAGGRILELKTVQVDDELAIPRPCIDMRGAGLNVEWSQELRVEESLEEYVKGAMLVRILAESGKVPLAPGFTDTVWDLSVGYDLEGIRSAKVDAFLEGIRDARATVERLRAQIPGTHAELRELDYETRVADTVTLSTFHGCPPDEIEAICAWLLEEKRLHTIVKLNPTLLGPERVRRVLHDLGYAELSVPDAAFERDTKWDEMCGFVERLGAKAGALGVGFGVKFTNTLVVENDGGFLAPAAPEAYLSGPPLHVLAMECVAAFRERFSDRFPISFSAGVDAHNFADTVALGLVPVTVCSDLLRPGGYERAKSYFAALLRHMAEKGCDRLADLVTLGAAKSASYASGLCADPHYHRASRRAPARVESALELFDCLTCDLCLPVCPNAAVFRLPLAPRRVPLATLSREGATWHARATGELALTKRHQIAVLARFCNDCGNCDVFCPEEGGPYAFKPLVYANIADFEAAAPRDGFVLERDAIHGRIGGASYGLAGAERLRYAGPGFELELDASLDAASVHGEAEGDVDLGPLRVLSWIREGLSRI